MKAWSCAGVFVLTLSGCATAQLQGAQVVSVQAPTHVSAPSAVSSEEIARRSARPVRHKESEATRACKAGGSKACNELGDRLTSKHAYTEAREWYMASCKRITGTMVPTAERLVQLSNELTQLAGMRDDGDVDPDAMAATIKMTQELKSEASELKARIQGCFDVGDTLRLDAELHQSLKYFDTVCEFSTLVPAVGEAIVGLEHVVENACNSGISARAELSDHNAFNPQLFANVALDGAQPARAAQPAEEGMVFEEADVAVSEAPSAKKKHR